MDGFLYQNESLLKLSYILTFVSSSSEISLKGTQEKEMIHKTYFFFFYILESLTYGKSFGEGLKSPIITRDIVFLNFRILKIRIKSLNILYCFYYQRGKQVTEVPIKCSINKYLTFDTSI